jgi:hypothetical protein
LSKPQNYLLTKSSLLVACLLLASCGGTSNGSDDGRDTDLDGISDRNDNCINIANKNQENLDADSLGDVCDNDRDGDGVFDVEDDFPDNASQYLDIDGDGLGHTEDDDNDGDGINDDVDNCPYVANPDQADINGIADGLNDTSGLGDACELSGLNDTGQDRSGAFDFGNYSDCSVNELGNLQDCNYGRDALAKENLLTGNLAKMGAGDAGFDFTKLGADGEALVEQDNAGITAHCIKDNVTGLTWEGKKSGDASTVNGKNDLFYWFDEREDWNAGVVGTKDAGTTGSERYSETGRHCAGFVEADESTWCNTQAFINRMNAFNEGQGYCGFNDWRLPSLEELNSLADYGAPDRSTNSYQMAIDQAYFRFTQGSNYWTQTNDARLSDQAWTIRFDFGANYSAKKGLAYLVRLVRDEASQESASQESAGQEEAGNE